MVSYAHVPGTSEQIGSGMARFGLGVSVVEALIFNKVVLEECRDVWEFGDVQANVTESAWRTAMHEIQVSILGVLVLYR